MTLMRHRTGAGVNRRVPAGGAPAAPAAPRAAPGDCALVAPEARDAPDHVVARVGPEAEALERAAHAPEERALLDRVPHHHAVADADELQRQGAHEAGHPPGAHPGPRAAGGPPPAR